MLTFMQAIEQGNNVICRDVFVDIPLWVICLLINGYMGVVCRIDLEKFGAVGSGKSSKATSFLCHSCDVRLGDLVE